MSSDTTTYSAILCSLLAKRWEELGLTQREFFERSGIATGTWSRMMRGQAHFQIEDLRLACEALGSSVGQITQDADNLSHLLAEREGISVPSKSELRDSGKAMKQLVAGAALTFLLTRLLK